MSFGLEELQVEKPQLGTEIHLPTVAIELKLRALGWLLQPLTTGTHWPLSTLAVDK